MNEHSRSYKIRTRIYALTTSTLQEVEPSFRGSFSSIEASLQNFFELCSYALTMVYARPSQFGNPVLCTVASVFVAGGLYARFVRKRRGHLFHVSCCEKPRLMDQEYHTIVN